MSKRILCQYCQRPNKACICAFITPINNTIPVVILQHPSEIAQVKGTVALLARSLQSCQVIIGENFSENEVLQQLLAQYQGLLLYPGAKAQELSGSLLESLRFRPLVGVNRNKQSSKKIKPYCLFVIDGTWKKAYKIFMLCEKLQQLKQISLPVSLANSGRYTIRKVAKKNALSSLEACCYGLSLLENSHKFQALLAKFDDFNQFQLSFRPKQQLTHYPAHSLGKSS